MMDKLLALTRSVPGTFFLFARHPNDRQLARVAVHITREPLAKRERIARIGSYSCALLVKLARRDHVTVRTDCQQLAVKTEAEPTGLVDYVYGMASAQKRLHPRHELLRRDAPRRLGQSVIVLSDDHVEPRMNVQPELDYRAGESYFVNGSRECDCPFVMNDCFCHKRVSLTNSPVSFHAIYALQLTASARHALCLQTHRPTAQAAPRSGSS